MVHSEIDPYWYGKLIFDKVTKAIQWSKDSLFNKWCSNSWTCTCQKMNLDTDFTPFTKSNSKQITHLNVKHKTIKLDDSIGDHQIGLWSGDDFLYYIKGTIQKRNNWWARLQNLKPALWETIQREWEDRL